MGTCRPRTALVLGGAKSVWTDAAKALDLFDPDAVCAINDMIGRWAKRIDYAATLHHEKLDRWQAERARRGFNTDYVSVCISREADRKPVLARIDRLTPYQWPGMTASGSSGLYAAKVLIEDGFDRIILAGVPMTAAGAHFFNPERWTQVESFKAGWVTALPHIRDKVRSMSGWTQELLGAPSENWITR